MDGSRTDATLVLLHQLKEKPAGPASWLPVFQYGRKVACLEPVTFWDLGQPEKIACLTRWRQASTSEVTRHWLAEQVLATPGQLVFWVKTLEGTAIGYIGLGNHAPAQQSIEIIELRRGVAGILPGVMYAATQTILAWVFQTLGLREIALQVPRDNVPALRLCERCGFDERPPTPAEERAPGEGTRRSITRSDWMAGHRADRAA